MAVSVREHTCGYCCRTINEDDCIVLGRTYENDKTKDRLFDLGCPHAGCNYRRVAMEVLIP